jgi:hypothetical protein
MGIDRITHPRWVAPEVSRSSIHDLCGCASLLVTPETGCLLFKPLSNCFGSRCVPPTGFFWWPCNVLRDAFDHTLTGAVVHSIMMACLPVVGGVTAGREWLDLLLIWQVSQEA